MIFKNPAILYGLLFLIVPIIVHLFQLRRFTKVDFTNVAFLKPLITQTRKSRKLKKWLTLLARLAAIACIVIAFAQPFLPGSDVATQEKQTAIYLDNSYSMQATGSKGELFKSAVTELLEKLPNNQKVNLFTNDNTYRNTTKKEITNQLLAAPYSAQSLSYEQIQLKASALLDDKDKRKELIMISDFQKNQETFPDTIAGLKRELVVLKPEESMNVSIDTAFISKRIANSIDISVVISSNDAIGTPITVSLENNGILAAKTSVNLQDKKGTAIFNYDTSETLNGRIYIEDSSLKFDNSLFISSTNEHKIKVLAVNESDGTFLQRIFTNDEFDFTAVQSRDLNYNLLKEQNLIVLNELNNISTNLALELNNYLKNGGYLVIIPAAQPSGYESINGVAYNDVSNTEKKITQINFNHPLLKGVFNQRVTNFQYPKVNSTVSATAALNPILTFDDGTSFLYQQNNIYLFTAPLNDENSNFKNSPLIVPVIYNMGRNSLPVPQLFYNTGTSNKIAINAAMNNDEILELYTDKSALIPKQRAYDSFVLLELEDELKEAGNYQVRKGNEPITTLSFNNARDENLLDYFTPSELGAENLSYSIDDLMYKLSEEDNILNLWKYFVLGALFFLLCELLILKFLK